MCVKIHKFKDSGIPVKYVICNNARENKSLEKRAENSDWKLGLHFYYSDRDTPQQNHLDGIFFEKIYSRGRALIHTANITGKLG